MKNAWSLHKVINSFRKDWPKHLDDTLSTYITTFNTPLGMSIYRLVYDKACHLPVKLQHKAF